MNQPFPPTIVAVVAVDNQRHQASGRGGARLLVVLVVAELTKLLCGLQLQLISRRRRRGSSSFGLCGDSTYLPTAPSHHEMYAFTRI
uniref:Secreted protein n=1 Tax=Panagrellus redivivus TaxID=6233 RepID=A0A7E4ZV81_PANRE